MKQSHWRWMRRKVTSSDESFLLQCVSPDDMQAESSGEVALRDYAPID
jgi:hypothetical protein